MILQSLSVYYNRLRDDPEVDIPLPGFGSQKIYFALLIKPSGELIQVLDLRETPENRPLPKILIVPQGLEERSGAKIDPHFMWDNTMYVLGNDNKGKPKRSLQAFEAFKKFHHDLGDDLNDEGIKAVLNFLDSWDTEDAPSMKYWDEMAGMNVVFQLDGDLQYIHERPNIREAWLKHLTEKGREVIATCLVSGKETAIARLHPAIKGVRGAQQKGAAIVSFNLDAFKSYGKDQSYNAPVGEDIAFSYTTALNYLLRADSRQKVRIGDASTLFWAERESPLEGIIESIWGFRTESKNLTTETGDLKDIRDFLEAARDGKQLPGIDPDINFYILGLSPNASRLSVRFWRAGTVGDITAKIGRHFSDLSITKNFDNEPDFPSMWQILKETALLRKPENIAPVLAGAVMRSILTGAAYPQSLLTAIINRIRADRTVNYLRSAIIKACLTRRYRINNKAMEVGMSLNKETTNIGYRLGRLFAVLERVQERANPKIKATIRDRCYAAGSSTPRIVFPLLLRLKNHHISKMKNRGEAVNLEKRIGEIIDGINNFPSHFDLEKQGLFALGYYHQRQVFKNLARQEEREEEEKS